MKKLLTLISLSLMPLAAAASEEGGGHHGWTDPIWGVPMIVWQFVNLGLVVALFYYLLKVRLPAFFKSRAIEIENALKKAREEEAMASQKLKELEDKMASLDDEVAKIQKDALEAAEREKAALGKKAEESAAWLRAEAEEEFSRREREAEKRLRETAVDEALKLARALIEKNLSAEDREKVFAEFQRELKERVNG